MTCVNLNEALVDLVVRLEGANSVASSGIWRLPDCRARRGLRSVRAAAFSIAASRKPNVVQTQAAIAGTGAERRARHRRPRLWRRPGVAGRGRADSRRYWSTLINSPAPPTTIRPVAAAETAADPTVESQTAEFAAAEKHYQKAIDDLQTIATRTGELDRRRRAAKESDRHRSGDHDRAALSRSRRAATRKTACSMRYATGGVIAADGRIDQRNAQGQSSRSRSPDPDAGAIAR